MSDEAADQLTILGEILQRDDYLSKVLECLIDDGLEDCRLVCRRWNSVCNKLPVKLTVKDPTNTKAVGQIFPNARSLSLDWKVGVSDNGRPSTGAKKPMLCLGEVVFCHMSLLTDLKIFGRIPLSCAWSSSDCLADYLPLIHRLQSLSVYVDTVHDDFVEHFFSCSFASLRI